MLNYIWVFMLILGIVYAIFSGNVEQVADAVLNGPGEAVKTILAIGGVMCFWTGLLNIAKKSGVINYVKKALKPIFRILFPRIPYDSEASDAIVMNMSANFLGMGNAATPFGIKAVKELRKLNNNSDTASNEMCMFVVINSSSFTLIPSTIIALLKSYDCSNPFEILVPMWIVSILSLISGIVICKIFEYVRRK